tara:strand:- start:2832 stop:4433 length:1602 start_codon:yes stop_codon:yes gene_type:complete
MADIPIWPGSSSFELGDTPFGFYDSDTDFQSDAPKVANWCAQRLGYPLVDIELQEANLFSAFEEAVTEYGHQVYTFQITNNMFRIIGNSTSSALNRINLSDYYGTDSSTGTSLQGSGTSYNLADKRLYSASLDVVAGRQKYNLLSHKAGYATTTIEFNSTASVSSSITITDTPGTTVTFTAHASGSGATADPFYAGYHVSASLFEFETGSDALDTATKFKEILENTLTINVEMAEGSSSASTTLNLTQRTEGPDGNTDVTFHAPLFNATSSQFSGGSTGLNFEVSGSAIQAGNKRIKIKKIYHHAPAAINRYFDPYAGTGTGIQSLMQTFGFGNYSPGVNFMLMPLYFDVLKLQAIEMNDQIRKSHYHFEINAGQFLKLFPIPNRNEKLWFEYTMADSSVSPAITTGADGEEEEKPTDLVTDISNAPYENPTYSFINAPGRQWIRKYTLALAKEMLGGIRGKYQSLPIPGAETTLDFSRLLSEASAEKTALIEQLRTDLDANTTLEQKKRSSLESEQQQLQYSLDNPYQIYIH